MFAKDNDNLIAYDARLNDPDEGAIVYECFAKDEDDAWNMALNKYPDAAVLAIFS